MGRPASFVCSWMRWSCELCWYESMLGSSAHLQLSHDVCDLFRLTIQISGRKSSLWLIYAAASMYSPPHTHTHWCVIGNKKQPLKVQSKIFLPTCWNLTKAGNQKNPQQVAYFFLQQLHIWWHQSFTRPLVYSMCCHLAAPVEVHRGSCDRTLARSGKKALNKDKTDRWQHLGVLSLLRRLLSHQDNHLILPVVCPVLPARQQAAY